MRELGNFLDAFGRIQMSDCRLMTKFISIASATEGIYIESMIDGRYGNEIYNSL